MSDDDLELRTTDELITELMGRFDHGIFAGLHIGTASEDGTGDNDAMHVWKGNSLTCCGLACECQQRVLLSRQASTEQES